MISKLLAADAWRSIALKCNIQDNGLGRALALYGSLDDFQYDDRLKAVAAVGLLAGTLRKAREMATLPDAAEYLNDLINVAEFQQREISREKVLSSLPGFSSQRTERTGTLADAKASG